MSAEGLAIDFHLPDELIARNPSGRRDQCRMLVYNRATQQIQHKTFNEITEILTPEYFLILNQARVNPSRIFWNDPKGKKQEIIFLKYLDGDVNVSRWEAIVSGKKLKTLTPYAIDGDMHFMLQKDRENSIARIQVNRSHQQVEAFMQQKGQLPLPPYILSKRRDDGIVEYSEHDEKNYQTVFSKQSGAVASPTAGLHFTENTFAQLKEKGIDWDFIHLSVGWGTFAPLNESHFKHKKLHPEFFSITPETASKILSEKKKGKKILAVGTTVVRSLESWAQNGANPEGVEGNTELFIIPPHQFKMPDAMLTNFHIPNSSLLLLVAAFLGENGVLKIKEIYAEAIEKGYQFYSYGDCMLIL